LILLFFKNIYIFLSFLFFNLIRFMMNNMFFSFTFYFYNFILFKFNLLWNVKFQFQFNFILLQGYHINFLKFLSCLLHMHIHQITLNINNNYLLKFILFINFLNMFFLLLCVFYCFNRILNCVLLMKYY